MEEWLPRGDFHEKAAPCQSDSDSIMGRFSFSNNNLTPPGAIPPPLDAGSFSSGDFLNNARNLVIPKGHFPEFLFTMAGRKRFSGNAANRIARSSSLRTLWPDLVWTCGERLIRTEVRAFDVGEDEVLRWNRTTRQTP